MSNYISFNWNGRARVLLTMVLLIPPLLMPILILNSELSGWDGILFFWFLIMLIVTATTYVIFVVAKLLDWMKQGLSEPERVSLVRVSRWLFCAVGIMGVVTILSIFRYDVMPLPDAPLGTYLKFDRWSQTVAVEKVSK